MASGVTIIDPATAYIGPDVTIAPDTVIHPNVYLEGRTDHRLRLRDSVRGPHRQFDARGQRLHQQLLRDHRFARSSRGAKLGPFAHIRPDSHVGEDAHVGNFVELKKTTLGRGSKANHLAYLGDAVIGEKVNVGAGTITCNYDGKKKHQTTIEDGAFIGSDSQLIAPVTVGAGAYVAAGSSITENVPAGSLAIARGKQINKEGWVEQARRR